MGNQETAIFTWNQVGTRTSIRFSLRIVYCDWHRKRHVSVVPASEANQKDAWDLPQHPVTNVKKSGKSGRVTNASLVYQSTSLSCSLLKGPDLLSNLTGLNFRSRVAVFADIEAMFMQVSVPPSNRRFLRYSWRNEIHEYKLHIFGATDSPCAAGYAVRQCAKDNKTVYSVARDLVTRPSTWMTSTYPLIPLNKQRICAETSKQF